MSLLSQIESFIQPCVKVIASVINAHVTVVDDELVRIGGSGLYAPLVGKEGFHDSFFEKLLQTGEPGLVADTRQDAGCADCTRRENCETRAVLGFPIHYQGNVIGIIGISAFDDVEYAYIIENHKKLLEFVQYIGLLIENQLRSVQYADQLKLRLEVVSRQNSHSNIIGECPKMQELFALAERVTGSDSTVLITGESGTGKEEMAKYLHSRSLRNDGPMISVNCGAIPENLIESELFGYEGGSFTGAKKNGAVGKFELADTGTLFLDEVGELSPAAQTKLLRFLQERTIERVGGKKPIPIDVRIIAATNQDLEQMVHDHTFRQDLYYRLNVIPMKMPPLREREGDIFLLAEYYLDFYNKKLHKNLHGFDLQARTILRAYSWPGNVRELKNIVEYLVNIAVGEEIRAEDLPTYLRQSQDGFGQGKQTLAEMVQNYERSILETHLKYAATRKEKLLLAKKLGISQATLYRKIAQYHL